MKILDVSEFYSPTGGGVRSYVDQKFGAAAKYGHLLTVIAPGASDAVEIRKGGKLIWVKAPQLPFDRNYRMFWRATDVWRVIDEEGPDLIEGSSPWRGGWIAARWSGPAAKVLFMHADPVAVYPQTLFSKHLSAPVIDRLFGWYWRYLRRLNGCFDSCVVAGQWLADRFASHGLQNLQVVPFGVETAWFRSGLRDCELREDMLKKCGLGADAALLINVGRHHPEKRVGTAIRAVTKAQQTRPIGLYLIGDGFIHGSIKAAAAQASNVHVAGWVKDRGLLARMIASADALLHCSSAETYGFAVAEALSCGTPVIVPDAGGAGDLAGSGHARRYAAGDHNDASSAIIELLALDRTHLSQAALDFANHRVGDIESHFERLFQVYEEIVRRKYVTGAVIGDRATVGHATT